MSKSALAITEEHNDLADAAFGQLNRLNSRAAARATLEDASSHPADIWSAAGEIGWTGLAIAEEHGGSGFGLAELAVVLEAQGHELCPGPFLPSVAAAVVIDRCAPDSVRAQLLPGLADGSTVGALAISGEVAVGSDLVVTGECRSECPVVRGRIRRTERRRKSIPHYISDGLSVDGNDFHTTEEPSLFCFGAHAHGGNDRAFVLPFRP